MVEAMLVTQRPHCWNVSVFAWRWNCRVGAGHMDCINLLVGVSVRLRPILRETVEPKRGWVHGICGRGRETDLWGGIVRGGVKPKMGWVYGVRGRERGTVLWGGNVRGAGEPKVVGFMGSAGRDAGEPASLILEHGSLYLC